MSQPEPSRPVESSRQPETSRSAAPGGPEAPRAHALDTILLIFGIIAVAAVAGWLIPPGAFQTDVMLVEGVGEREVVVPNTFSYLERPDVGVLQGILATLAAILLAPIRGITDPDAIPIIAFVLLVGGTFAVLQATGAVDAGLRRLVALSERNRSLRVLLIPLFMTLFSLGGATFGMAEEVIPFVLIFVPLALALGYDTITGVAIPFVGSQAGFAAAFLNPFTVGVAQGIAEVPLFSGIAFRMVVWAIVTALAIALVMWHARRVRRYPERSPTYELDRRLRGEGTTPGEPLAPLAAGGGAEAPPLTGRRSAVLVVFALGIGLLVYGVLEQGWYIFEIAALFVGLGIAMGAVGGLGATAISRAFQEGARDLVVTALIIGLARGILIVLRDAQVIDTILYALSSVVDDVGPALASHLMFVSQTALNFFIPSGSGQAALSMPLMAPLADLVGVTRQTAVLAFQMGDGFTNLIIPTSAILMGILSLAKVPWTTWARWILPFQVVLFALGLIVLTIAVTIGYGEAGAG